MSTLITIFFFRRWRQRGRKPNDVSTPLFFLCLDAQLLPGYLFLHTAGVMR